MAAPRKKRNADGLFVEHIVFAIRTCADKWHHNARKRFFAAVNERSIVAVSLPQFNTSTHNVSAHSSFDEIGQEDSMDEFTKIESSDN